MSEPSPSLLSTPLHDWHAAHGGRLVEFGGWSMPLLYANITDEHRAVRERAGLFDIGHMGRLYFSGPEAAAWIDRTTTNAVARLEPWQIQYSLMANEDGGLLDDILVYRLGDAPGPEDDSYLVVCNASNRLQVVERFRQTHLGADARMVDRTTETAMIAVQGPAAAEIAGRVASETLEALSYYHAGRADMLGHSGLVSRTGYTGEDGFEIIVPRAAAQDLWVSLLEAGRQPGVQPCGLGARDTLRFEAAMPLYGHELGAEINPYEAGVGWAVKLSKGPFHGREALKQLKRHPGRTRVGLELGGKRIGRQGAVVSTPDGRPVGVVTSGTFAPTLGKALAMALIEPTAALADSSLSIDVRGQAEPARVVPLPFYRRAGAR